MKIDSVHEAILAIMKNKKRGKVLDAGAGRGRLALILNKEGFEVTACDKKPKKISGIDFHTVDLEKKLPYKNNFFDFICCAEVIEHLTNPYNLLNEFSRVLKKNGELFISTPNVTNIFSRLKFFFHGDFYLFGERERKSGHKTPIPYWLMQNLLENNGFKLLDIMVSNSLELSGKKSSRNLFKKIFAKTAYVTLKPLLKPTDSRILKGDSLIFHAKKVR